MQWQQHKGHMNDVIDQMRFNDAFVVAEQAWHPWLQPISGN